MNIPARKPLRLWPGFVAAVLLCLLWFVVPIVEPEAIFFGMIGGFVCVLAILVWWLFFSRAPWSERVGAIVLMIVAMFATLRIVHVSIRTGMMGMMLPVSAIPVLSLALVAGAAAARGRSARFRRAAIVAAILLLCGVFTLLRTEGIKGFGSELAWRWTKTPEERLLAQAAGEPKPPSAPAATKTAALLPSPAEMPKEPLAAHAGDKLLGSARGGPAAAPASPAAARTEPAAPAPAETPAEWPGFRGPGRDGVVRGVRINPDWSTSPPVQMWRRAIGPGWSSFAVRGDLLYTQEQRGEDEIVACYKVSTGEPVWRHRDAVRFWESNGGAGPRATPALDKDRVYAFGATGILNALDAAGGKALWSRNVASDTGRKVPTWGFASSPLVVGDVVIVAAAGTMAGYDSATGKLRWRGPFHGGSYSSPHRATIGGAVQVLLLGGPGAISVAPATGDLLWEHAWAPGPIVQPAMTEDGDVLINTIAATGGLGLRRLAVTHQSGGWTVKERWTSSGLKPYFNDFVVHKGHAFGFDGSILACIDLEDGKRKWKGGRYGNGQLVLLHDQDLLLVLSEDGELALVGAGPDQFRELARVPALEGKTWNHPVLVGNVLLVRNGEEMAAFRLSPPGR
ncbi:MAG: PQQ-binding-like beta-propeller repeat protein [Acidobacteria bacterium]|nr:PQQ-binding-like beta-propeller repeat protein [Acidobacteriota bacterium]